MSWCRQNSLSDVTSAERVRSRHPITPDTAWLKRSHLKQKAVGCECRLSTVRQRPLVDKTQMLKRIQCGQDRVRSGGAPARQSGHRVSGSRTLCARPTVPWDPCTWTLVCAQGAHPACGRKLGATRMPGGCTRTPHLQAPPNVRRKLYQFLWPHDGQDPGVRQKLLVVQPGLLNGQRTGGREVKRPLLPQAPGTWGSPGRDQPAQHRALGLASTYPGGRPARGGCSGSPEQARPASARGAPRLASRHCPRDRW